MIYTCISNLGKTRTLHPAAPVTSIGRLPVTMQHNPAVGGERSQAPLYAALCSP
jgi:hypothetical protein